MVSNRTLAKKPNYNTTHRKMIKEKTGSKRDFQAYSLATMFSFTLL